MPFEFKRFKAAAVQAAPVFMDKDATIEKACKLISEAGRNGAELIVFPETYIPTYPYWAIDYSESTIFAVGAALDLYKNSVEIPSRDTDLLCEAAREANAIVVMGLNEREEKYKGTLFNTLLFINSDGKILGRHRKLIPTLHERIFWGRGDGSDLRVFDTRIGKLGGLICYENHMTLAKYAMAAMGEEVHCMVWPGWPTEAIDYNIQPIIDAAVREYAFETQTFVISACDYITKEMVPDTFHYKEKTCWDSGGGSSIVDPLGNYLAGPELRKETILYADIDMSTRAIAKIIFDAVGHYTRWDVLSLNINTQPYTPLKPVKLHEPKKFEIDAEKIEKIAEKLDITVEKINALIKELEKIEKQ